MIKTIFQSLFAKVLVAAINFIILIASSKYLGVSSRGEISIFILNLGIVQAISGVYTGYNIVHFVPKFNLRKMLSDGVLFTFLFASMGNFIVVFFEKQVPGYEWAGWILSLLVILNTFNCMLLLGRKKISAFNLLSILQPLLLAVGIVFYTLVNKVYTVEAYLTPLIVSFSVAFIVSGFMVIKEVSQPQIATYHLKEVLLQGLFYQAGVIMFMFSNRLSYYLLPNKASVGLYSSAVTIMEAVLIIANGITPALLAKVANDTDQKNSASITLALTRLSVTLSVCAIILLLLLPETWLLKALGNGFSGIKVLMFWYSLPVISASAIIPLTAYFSASGKQKVVLITYTLGFVMAIILLPPLISMYGVKGAAFSACVSFLFMVTFLLTKFFSKNNLPFSQIFNFSSDIKYLLRLLPTG